MEHILRDFQKQSHGQPTAAAASLGLGSKTPTAGWELRGYTYLMEGWSLPANIYLARSPDGSERSVELWIGSAPPTPYHGSWEEREGGALYLMFNGRGPGMDPWGAERRLHGVYLHCSAENPHIYTGRDHKNRRVTIKHDRTWLVADSMPEPPDGRIKRQRSDDLPDSRIGDPAS